MFCNNKKLNKKKYFLN